MRLATVQSLKTQLRLAPHLVLSCSLLRASGTELDELVRQELRSNPALEWREYACDFFEIAEYLPARQTTREQLLQQLHLELVGTEQQIAEYLVHCLDAHGFLQESIYDLASELGVTVEVVKRVVMAMQNLDPPVGMRNVQDFLLFQLLRKEAQNEDGRLACQLLTETWDDFSNQRWRQAARKLHVSVTAIEKARDYIVRHLKPYPTSLNIDDQYRPSLLSFPDIIILGHMENDTWVYTIVLPQENNCEVRLRESFLNGLYQTTGSESQEPEAEHAWMYAYAERTRLFIAAIRKRWITLRQISESLVEHQSAFLEKGPLFLKPLSQAAIARELGIHESTVSRAISDKIVQLPNGQKMLMSDFFDASIAAQEAIRRMLDSSETPLNDREISERLKLDGFPLARRTVAKYRKQLNIQASYHHTI